MAARLSPTFIYLPFLAAPAGLLSLNTTIEDSRCPVIAIVKGL